MSTERAHPTRDTLIAEEDEARLQTPTHLVEGPPLFDSDAASSGPNSGASSPEPNDEEAIFTLLFQQCDNEGTGEVGVEQLISYIRKVRLGQQHGDKEEVYDSQEDVPTMQYNLHLLKAMLDCNSTPEGKVDQPTYSHIIRMWVKDVRDRSDKAAAPEPPLEVSRLSDSPDSVAEGGPFHEVSYGSYATGGGDESRESFETSGGLSSSHTEHDRIDLINSIADLKLDNKRLQEQNKALQIQMDGSEEHLKEIQTENHRLKQQIKEFQASLNRLEQVEGDNTKLATQMEEWKKQCEQLTSNVEKCEREVELLREDLKSTRAQLSATELDKNTLAGESNALKTLLLQKEESLSHQEVTCVQMKAQLQLEEQRVKELSHALEEVKLTRDELKSENSDLQTQLRLGRVRSKQPLSSTPYRPNAPSWHEEMMEQESLTSKSSPILRHHDDVTGVGVVNGVSRGVKGEMDEEMMEGLSASESFTKILEETHVKINQKHNLLVRGLSDLINQPSPSSSHRSVDNSRMVIQEKMNDRSMQSFESKLTELLRKKRKVEKENSRLAAQVEELKQRLADLERAKVAVNGDAQPTMGESVDTGANAERAPVDENATEAFRSLDTSASYLFPADSAPAPELRRRPNLSRSAMLAQVDFDGGSVPPLSLFSSSSVEKSQQTDPDVISGGVEEGAFQKAYDSEPSDKELADLKERQDELSSQCAQLEERAEKLTSQREGWTSYLAGSAYRILKSVALLLLIIFLVLFLIVLYVALMDLLSTCGSHCPHSPAYVFYSKLNSCLQYTRTSSPI